MKIPTGGEESGEKRERQRLLSDMGEEQRPWWLE